MDYFKGIPDKVKYTVVAVLAIVAIAIHPFIDAVEEARASAKEAEENNAAVAFDGKMEDFDKYTYKGNGMHEHYSSRGFSGSWEDEYCTYENGVCIYCGHLESTN